MTYLSFISFIPLISPPILTLQTKTLSHGSSITLVVISLPETAICFPSLTLGRSPRFYGGQDVASPRGHAGHVPRLRWLAEP